MALNNITFAVQNGGLGRQEPNADNVSALLFAVAAPGGWPTNKFKSFTKIEDVSAAGIIKGHATLGEAYYHAAEFFRMAPGATLWIGLNATLPTYQELFTATGGKVRQVGVYFSTFADLGSIHQAGITTLTGLHAPAVVIAGFRPTTAATLATIQDLAALPASQVSVVAAGDGAGDGKVLADALSLPYIPALGAVLGATAAAAVNESIAWVGKFNFSNGKELETLRMPDGTNDPTESTLDALNTKRYLVFRKFPDTAGTYLNDSHTVSAIANNDFAYLEPNRTMQKARRKTRTALLTDLNSPLTVDGDTGKLAPGTIGYFEGKIERLVLTPMQAAGEISDGAVYINPDQNVLTTSLLQITVRIVPRGVARNIEVNIGFAVSTQL